MGKLLCDPAPLLLPWPGSPPPPAEVPAEPASTGGWESVRNLDEQQRKKLEKMHVRGVYCSGMSFSLSHGGDVEADGNCLFTAARLAMGSKIGAGELRARVVRRFLEDYGPGDAAGRDGVDGVVRHLYSPDLRVGWGIHVVQEVKMIVGKADREAVDSAVRELVDLGMERLVLGDFMHVCNRYLFD